MAIPACVAASDMPADTLVHCLQAPEGLMVGSLLENFESWEAVVSGSWSWRIFSWGVSLPSKVGAGGTTDPGRISFHNFVNFNVLRAQTLRRACFALTPIRVHLATHRFGRRLY